MPEPLPRLDALLADRYRIERQLGQGGMATIYLAHDLKHDRPVAVKVLRPELAAVIGAERFLAEIKTTANLQHPHILPLHDSGTVDGTVYYVMPLVEGESLRDRLTREKQLPVADAVRIASEVASALDYAHRHGVVHRDIKPENILLHDGQALVADFGIALAATTAGGSRMTETGMSLGTPHYMSPEQAMGEREITARSDVYALGAMTYEMLVGEPPFTGPTAQAIIAKVMTSEPASITGQRKSVPPAVEEAVLTALEKLPADRFASAADFAAALGGARPATSLRRTAARGAAVPVASRRGAIIGLSLALAASAGLALWGWLRRGPPPQFPSKLAILVPGLGGSGGPALQRQLTLTQDGSTVIYVVVGSDGVNRLVRQSLDATEPTTIPGSDGLASPVISPDGQWILATQYAQGPYRLPAEGGTRSPLPAAVVMTSFADWDGEGSLWVGTGGYAGGGLMQILAQDSVVRRFTDRTEDLELEQVLPGGRMALMVRKVARSLTGPVVVFDLHTGESTTVLDRLVLRAEYSAGFLVLALLDGTLQAIPFDLRSKRVTGTAATIGTGVSISGNGFAQVATALNGTVAYIPEEPRSLLFYTRDGGARPAVAARHNFHAPMFSPDGRRLSTDFISSDGRDVWILALDQGTLTRATFDRDGHDATWTPDGRYLTYSSNRGGSLGIVRTRPGSATAAESLFASQALFYTGLWLPDGSAMLTVGVGLAGASGNDIALVANGGRGPLTPLIASPFNESYPSLSPDGKWIAFISDQSGQQEVYVRPLQGDGDQVQISLSGATEPLWSKDGRELFYRSAGAEESHLMVAAVRTSPHFEVLSRRALFSMAEVVGTNPHTNYDVSRDGTTFAMVQRSPATRVMIIQNLPELVRRLRGVPGD